MQDRALPSLLRVYIKCVFTDSYSVQWVLVHTM